MIRVKLWENRMGDIHGLPVRQDLQDMLADHMKEMTGHASHSFFFQEGMEAEDFKEQNLSPRQKKEIESGWNDYINVDLWEMAHWYGYDAHTLFE